ncbi:MAG: lipopolysaccharide heptosyltransferase II [Candidatus Eisenbacteria sp.]|nr:lipopolysaccharide heptosyltransferase II [Candidatus Eisenbacteria bacterium]
MEYVFFIASALVSRIVNARGFFRQGEFARILVFKLDHLGDIVTATPALEYLRKEYPEAEITLVVGPWAAPLLDGYPGIDRLVVYASPKYARVVAPSQGRNLRFLLPHTRYDLIVGLRDDWSTLEFSLFAGAKRRADRGTVRLRDRIGRIMSRLRRVPEPAPLHEVETNLRIVGAGALEDSAGPHLQIPEDALEWADREVARLADNVKGYVVFHPGAYSPLRRWPMERFVDVARWLRQARDLGVVITGSAQETDVAEAIAGKAGPGVLSLAGKTSLARAVAVISRARAMLSVDTGLMHVATAVGTPVVALVGPEDPARFGPFGPDHVTLYHNFPCSPCNQVRCSRKTPECMEAITVQETIDALAHCLDRAASTP